MNICIVGAGFSGLTTAKVLLSFGHKVTVFEKEAEVGGVWISSRRYPGLTTQNVRSTYALSDFPYPSDYPEWPSGEQVQQYLAAYTRKFGLENNIQLNTEVLSADPEGDQGWIIKINSKNGHESTQFFDYLIICDGVFSKPMIPNYPGAEDFVRAGGRLYHTSEFGKVKDANGKDVLVVGYGKSSCDVAQAVASSAASTTVVARQLIWKIPKKLMNVLNYKYLFLTRLGEGLFKYIRLSGFDRWIHGIGKPIRNFVLSQVQWVITRQCRLNELDLHPQTDLETIARSTVSLVTDGFYENVAQGKIKVAKNACIVKFSVENGKRYAVLSTGEALPADIVVCGTGFNQVIPFLNKNVMESVTDDEGNFKLYRSILPIGVPRLAFNGYNSSLFCQLSAEISALWIADYLGGALKLPSETEQRTIVDERLAWMEERTEGKHSKGTSIVPFSVHHIDELLGDMRLQIDVFTRFKQWVLPINPTDYGVVTKKLLRRYDK